MNAESLLHEGLSKYRVSAELNLSKAGGGVRPFDYIFVNPREVNHWYRPDPEIFKDKYLAFGSVMGGDWDRDALNKRCFLRYFVYEDTFRRVCCGESWEATGIVEKKLDELKRSKKEYIDGCKTRRDFIERYRNLDKIFEDIKRAGWSIQADVEGGTLKNEMCVSVGRKGDFFFSNGGNHRLAFAKYAGLEKIPFLVMVRHEKWWNFKSAVEAGDVDSPFPHPDLK